MSDSSFDISRFLSDNDKVTKETLEIILNTFTPIQDNTLESFLELPVNENYKKCQEQKLKDIAIYNESKKPT
jgi:hypothetical protein